MKPTSLRQLPGDPATALVTGQVERRLTTLTAGRALARRAAAATRNILEGYAAVFHEETIIAGLFREKVLPGAFAESIRRDDICGQFNHDPNFILGRTGNGTVRLTEDRDGLHYEIDLNAADPQAMRVGAIAARGDLAGSSFAFSVQRDVDEEWVMEDPKLLPLRIIKRAKLFDVAPVTTPAYPQTTVSAATAARFVTTARSSGRAVPVEVEIELLEIDFELLELDAAAYTPGPLGVLERELALLEMDL